MGGRFPRVAQHKNLLIALFDIPEHALPGPHTVFPEEASGNAMPSPGPAEEKLLDHTVAVFRRAPFDQVIEKKGWILGRKREGYLALYSQNPTTWTPDGVLTGEGLIAPGRKNIWICQLGRRKTDGDFASWSDKIVNALLETSDLKVNYEAPQVGPVSFAWDEPLLVNHKSINLGDYPRFKNIYCQADYESAHYAIVYQNRRLILDFNACKKSVKD